MQFFSKKEDQISRVTPGYEETERQTPKAGYILLIAMFAASLFFGWRAISDLQDVPEKPTHLSQCAIPFLTYSWEDYGRFQYESYPTGEVFYDARPFKPASREMGEECVFSELEKKYGIPPVFEKRRETAEKLNDARVALNEATYNLLDRERQYGLGLQEREVKEIQPLFPTNDIRREIEALREKKSALEGEVKALEEEIKPYDDELQELYKGVMRDYRKAWRWYEFKVFLLEMVFVIPFFFLVLWGYFRLLAKNSPYTIIFTALVGVASVLFLRVFLVWFWGLFLARVIQTIWEYIQNFALLKSLIFYSGMILSIAVFGGAVYLLQKRIFDPHRVALRRLRDKQCPNCRMPLEVGGQFCPNCGRKLKETCAKCGKERWSDFPSCPYCGSKD